MNIYNYSIPPFCKASAEELEAIKYFYGLQMDTSALLAVQKHFYTLELRDPTADELALLDSFYHFNRKNVNNTRINSVRSSDKNVGDAFADIVKKLEALDGQRRAAYSYSELLGVSQRALGYFKDTVNYKLPVAYCTPSPLLSAMNDVRAKDHVSVSCNGFDFTVSDQLESVPDKNTYNVCDSDHFVFFCKSEENDSLENMIFKFKNTLGNTVLIKKVLKTDETGIIGAVLRSADGAFLNLSMLASLPYSFSPRNLSVGLPSECAVAVVSELSIVNTVNSAQRFGLTAIPFGRPTKAKRLTITYGYGAPISIASDFIRSLASTKLEQADVPKLDGKEYSETFYAESKPENYVAHVSGEKLVSAVSLESGGFVGAAETLIYGVSKLVSFGVEPTNMISTVSVNTNTYSNGEILSRITGIYRVRAELSLASSNDCTVNGNTSGALCSLITAKCPKLPKPSHVAANDGGNVYLLYPRMSDDGLPKFSDLRRLFEYVISLIGSNKAISVRAVGVKGLKQCLDDMGYTDVNLPENAEKLAVCGSFVLESQESIEGLTLFTKKQ